MLIFDDNLKPTLITSEEDPVMSTVYWTLNLEEEDFMFSYIGFLEGHDERGVGLTFDGQYVALPESWYIVLADPFDGTLDLIQVKEIRGREFEAFVVEFHRTTPRTVPMATMNSRIYQRFCHPIMPKNLMMVHPIDEYSGIIISPHDQYNKYIKNKTMMDFLVDE